MRTLAIIPTFNERRNIGQFLDNLRRYLPEVDLLVVDDNSPDGTAEVVRSRMVSDSQISLLSRPSKQGLGTAYIAGFEWGLDRQYDVLSQVDGDHSHRIEDYARTLSHFSESDFCIGSRWVDGGCALNSGFFRKGMSYCGNYYAQKMLGTEIRDWTGGLNSWKRQVLESIDFGDIRSVGYSFQIELKYKALKKGFKVSELPIRFEARRHGDSKMSPSILWEAFFRVWNFSES